MLLDAALGFVSAKAFALYELFVGVTSESRVQHGVDDDLVRLRGRAGDQLRVLEQLLQGLRGNQRVDVLADLLRAAFGVQEIDDAVSIHRFHVLFRQFTNRIIDVCILGICKMIGLKLLGIKGQLRLEQNRRDYAGFSLDVSYILCVHDNDASNQRCIA